MKQINCKIRILVLIIALLILFVACSQVNPENGVQETDHITSEDREGTDLAESEEEANTSNLKFPEESGDVFLWYPSEAIGVPEVLTLLPSPQSYGIYTKQVSKEEENLVSTKMNTPFGELEYVNTLYSLKTTDKEEYGSFYSAYDVYRRNNGDEARYLHGTQTLTYLFRTFQDSPSNASDELTEERMKTIAEDFLLEILPEGRLEEYTVFACRLPDWTSGTISYGTTIHGYDTDDTILVMIDKDTHMVKGYNAECIGKYDTIANHLTKEMLDATKEKLSTKVTSMNLNAVKEKNYCLTTNTEGEVYMELFFEYSVDEEGEASTVMADSILTKVLPLTLSDNK